METKKRLKESAETLSHQIKKQTQQSTLKWVFILMKEITEVKKGVELTSGIQIKSLNIIKKILKLKNKIMKNTIFGERSAKSRFYIKYIYVYISSINLFFGYSSVCVPDYNSNLGVQEGAY